ncbi:Ubiquitin-like protein [Intoshia linei]|uniref:Ubiquitin-like protein n=1 Tax=Intoshia linei TaxID=1819745 RepID=A0A177B9J0_9BILA|nr:Ubiquitin-like protein [Intoshia linei]
MSLIDGHRDIIVRTLTGRTFNLVVNERDTIESVRGKIEEKEQYKVQLSRLVYKGETLDDYLTIADYNISNGETLNIDFKLQQCTKKETTTTRKQLIFKIVFMFMYLSAFMNPLKAGFNRHFNMFERKFDEIMPIMEFRRIPRFSQNS